VFLFTWELIQPTGPLRPPFSRDAGGVKPAETGPNPARESDEFAHNSRQQTGGDGKADRWDHSVLAFPAALPYLS